MKLNASSEFLSVELLIEFYAGDFGYKMNFFQGSLHRVRLMAHQKYSSSPVTCLELRPDSGSINENALRHPVDFYD